MFDNRITYHPLKYLLCFLVFTEVLFFIGPIDYNVANPFLIAVYFLILNYAFYIGYKKGVSRFRPSSFSLSIGAIHFFLIFGLILYLEYMIRKWATHGLSFSLSNLLFALTNPGDVYKGEALSDVNVNIFTGIILTPFRWASIPIGIYSWHRLSKFYKSIVVTTCLIYIFTWLGIGTRKGLMDLIMFCYFLIIAAYPKFITEAQYSKKIKTITISLLVVFVLFFIFSNLSRGGLSNFSDLQDLMNKKYNPVYEKYLPPAILSALSEITNYLCQGYNALNISLNDIGFLPPTVGGSSMSTWLYMERFFGYNPIPGTYMQILETSYGIDMYQCWHSMYLWLANDFTFLGVPFIIYAIGYFFAKVWLDCVNNQNIFAYPLCAFMIIMVFYFFANNQVISFNLEAFLGCIALYIYSKQKKN